MNKQVPYEAECCESTASSFSLRVVCIKSSAVPVYEGVLSSITALEALDIEDELPLYEKTRPCQQIPE